MDRQSRYERLVGLPVSCDVKNHGLDQARNVDWNVPCSSGRTVFLVNVLEYVMTGSSD